MTANARGSMAAWLQAASEDADRRGLPELKPLLETLARSTVALREADRVVRDEALSGGCRPGLASPAAAAATRRRPSDDAARTFDRSPRSPS